MRSVERTALYRLYGEGSARLYIGISNSPTRRFEQHAADKPWWGEVQNYSIEWHATRKRALAAERRAIERERPRYNQQHNHNNPDRVIAHGAAGAREVRRKVYPVGRWTPAWPLVPLAVLLSMFYRGSMQERAWVGLSVSLTVLFLVLVAKCWRPMWKNVRELWR